MAEKEYIEREAAIEAIDNSLKRVFVHKVGKSIIDKIPAADVRPVVLCRDCKYAHMTIDGLCKYCDRLTEIGVDDAVYLSGDFFCAAGEKREET